MNVTLDIDTSQFAQSLQGEFERVRIPCQTAMAEAFREVVNANLGDSGETEKPEWSGLSSKYSKRIGGRTQATLRMTAAEAARVGAVSELLYDSTGIQVTNPEFAVVYNDCQYAADHQYGTDRMPARPFFPISGGDVLPATTQKCVDACEETLMEVLR